HRMSARQRRLVRTNTAAVFALLAVKAHLGRAALDLAAIGALLDATALFSLVGFVLDIILRGVILRLAGPLGFGFAVLVIPDATAGFLMTHLAHCDAPYQAVNWLFPRRAASPNAAGCGLCDTINRSVPLDAV